MKKLKKLKKIVIAAGVLLSISAFTLNSKSEAATYTHVTSNSTSYWKVAKGFGVPLNSLETANHWSPLYAGKGIVIPNAPISNADKALMARLVHAEASGEPYAGKVAVASVILNRVSSPKFPNTVPGVIYQYSYGHYEFTPVENGQINQPADADSIRAVNEAIALMGKGNGSLYFYNPATSTSFYDASRQVTVRIGHHVFAK
jgi:N-acetylmuramoyl-L-alanine amidase